MAAEPRRDVRATLSRLLHELLTRFRGRLFGTLAGLGLGLMLWAFGFWWTLLILLLAGAGFLAGRRYDETEEGRPNLWEVLDRILPPDEG